MLNLLACTLLLATVAAQEVPPPPPSPVPGLLAMLDSDVPAVRKTAADRFAALTRFWFDGPLLSRAVAPLLRRLETERDEEVASAMSLALLELGPDPATALMRIKERLPAWRDLGAPPAALDGIAQVLAALPSSDLDRQARAVVPFLGAIARESPCRHDALALLTALRGLATAATPALVPLLQHEDPGERWRAAAALAAIGGGETAAFVAGLADQDRRVLFWSAQVLQRSEAKTLPAAAVLPWLEDECSSVSRRAIAAVLRLERVPDQVPQMLARALAGIDEVAVAAEATLVQLGPRAAAGVPTLAKLLEGDGVDATAQDVCRRAVHSLGAIGKAGTSAIPQMVDLAARSDPNDGVATETGSAMASIAPALAVTSLMHLWERQLSSNQDDWWSSARALAAMGTAASAELPRFMAAIERGPRAATANALFVIAAFGPGARPASAAVVRALGTNDAWIAWLAKDALIAMQTDAGVVMPALQKAFAENTAARASLLQGVHRLGAAAEPLLFAGCRTGDPTVGWVAEQELASLPAPSPEAVALMIARLQASTDHILLAAPGRRLAGVLADLPRVAPALVAQLPPLLEHEDFYVYTPVARVLARALRPAVAEHPAFSGLLVSVSDRQALRRALVDERALASWLRSLGQHQQAEVRVHAAQLLPLLAVDVEANRAMLQQLATDPEAMVRAAASTALQGPGLQKR